MGYLDGKVVIITGAGRGIGRAEALRCAQEGALLVLNDLGCDVEGRRADPAIVRDLASHLRSAGVEAVAADLDVADATTAARLVQLAMDNFGRIDGLICNAGVARECSVAKLDELEFDAVFDVQARSAFRLTSGVLPHMVRQRSGASLLFTISASGLFGGARQAHIAAASGAVLGFARSTAIEGQRHGIRANVIAPLARTRSTESLPMFQGLRKTSLTPEHVADVAAFLLSPLAHEISGEAFGVAGTRLYTLKATETAGAFASSDAFTFEELAKSWPEATR